MNITTFVFDLSYLRGGVFTSNIDIPSEFEKLFRRNNISTGYFRILKGFSKIPTGLMFIKGWIESISLQEFSFER